MLKKSILFVLGYLVLITAVILLLFHTDILVTEPEPGEDAFEGIARILDDLFTRVYCLVGVLIVIGVASLIARYYAERNDMRRGWLSVFVLNLLFLIFIGAAWLYGYK